MTEVRFYHLQRMPLERALPMLLERTLDRGWRAVVQADSQQRVEALNGQLWTYGKDSFLPHGTEREGDAELQPVWLTHREENPNGANVLFLVDGAESAHLADYELCCDMFDGRDEAAVAQARGRWAECKKTGLHLTYWQQNENGRWEMKAEENAALKDGETSA
jgi:DNA polymerase-3 subunit chi